MRSRMVFQVGLGVALMVGAVSVATAAEKPSTRGHGAHSQGRVHHGKQ